MFVEAALDQVPEDVDGAVDWMWGLAVSAHGDDRLPPFWRSDPRGCLSAHCTCEANDLGVVFPWAGALFPETVRCATDRIDGGRAWTERMDWNRL